MTEPLENVPLETPETAHPPEPGYASKKRARLGVVAGVAGMTVLVVLFAGLFAAFNNRSTVSGGAPPTSTVPAGWVRYTDPGGHFIVSIPKGWTVQTQTSTGIEGDSHGSVTFHDTMDAFGGPPYGQKTITVWIYVQPIGSDPARQIMCDNGFYKHSNTILAGLPALHLNDSWIVESSGAHFQINYAYPNYKGDVMIPANAPSPTPMPPGFYEKGQQDFHTMLASFMPTPDTPLKCP